MPNQQRLDVIEAGDVTIVRFRDEKIIEDRKIRETAQELFHLVEAEGRDRLIVSLRSVDVLSSAGLGKLITLHKKTTARGGRLKLCNVRPEILRVFACTRLDRLFDIEPDETRALAAFQTVPLDRGAGLAFAQHVA